MIADDCVSISSDDESQSWKHDAHTHNLKSSARDKYRKALLDFKSFLAVKKLPENYLPRELDFEFAPVAVLRRFAQHYAKTLKKKLKQKPHVNTVCHKISDLTSVTERLTGKQYTDDIIGDVQAYIKVTLVKEGLVTTQGREKFDFDRDDIQKTQYVRWTQLDPNCNSARKVASGRFMVFMDATMYLFGDYGARISAYLPKVLRKAESHSNDELWAVLRTSHEEHHRQGVTAKDSAHALVSELITGLRYKDLIVRRMRKAGSDQPEVVVTLASRFFKGNDNTEEDAIVTFATIHAQRFLQRSTPYILAFALGDCALKKYRDPKALFTQKINKNLDTEVCAWRENLKDQHIFREKMNSPKPYTQYQWDRAWQLSTKQAGYSTKITVHRIRQATVQAVNATGITPAQHQHLFNQSFKTFQKNYMNQVTSIDTQGIQSNGVQRTDIPQNLRSAKRSWCNGLPTKLTAAQRSEALASDPELLDLEKRRQGCQIVGDYGSRKKLDQQIRYRRRRVPIERLAAEQARYYQELQDADEEDSHNDEDEKENICHRRWLRLMNLQPERNRIAEALSAGGDTSVENQIALIEDLMVLVRQEEPVIDHQASDSGQCGFCYEALSNDSKALQRSSITEGSSRGLTTQCSVCRCSLHSHHVESHLSEKHLSDIPTDCGIFYYTSERQGQLIQPGQCPFCLTTVDLPLLERFKPFTTSRLHLDHISDHLKALSSSSSDCPYPECKSTCTRDELAAHLESFHGVGGLDHHLRNSTTSTSSKRKRRVQHSADGCSLAKAQKLTHLSSQPPDSSCPPISSDQFISLPSVHCTEDDWFADFLDPRQMIDQTIAPPTTGLVPDVFESMIVDSPIYSSWSCGDQSLPSLIADSDTVSSPSFFSTPEKVDEFDNYVDHNLNQPVTAKTDWESFYEISNKLDHDTKDFKLEELEIPWKKRRPDVNIGLVMKARRRAAQSQGKSTFRRQLKSRGR